jgi:hypothetical protein
MVNLPLKEAFRAEDLDIARDQKPTKVALPKAPRENRFYAKGKTVIADHIAE